jgi:hypothetical protein
VSEVNGVRYAPIPGKIPGTAVNLGGHEFVVPPLNLDLYVRYEKDIGEMGQPASTRERLEKVLPVFLVSLQRNYPELTLADLRLLIDFANARQLTDAIVETNALKLKAPGEQAPASP